MRHHRPEPVPDDLSEARALRAQTDRIAAELQPVNDSVVVIRSQFAEDLQITFTRRTK